MRFEIINLFVGHKKLTTS